jgi:hypothetical protein
VFVHPYLFLKGSLHLQYNDYALRIQRTFADEGYAVDVDLDQGDTLNKKVPPDLSRTLLCHH